jgi:hypothetical protein
MFTVRTHSHDDLRDVLTTNSMNQALGAAFKAISCDGAAFAEVLKGGDETVWDSHYGFAN